MSVENPDKLSAYAARKRLKTARRAAVWALGLVSVVAVSLSLLVVVLIGRTLTAPDWVRDRIETRIERNLAGMQIVFGDVEMVVNEGWRPRARLRDVTLSDADGRVVLALADAEASLAMRPLLQGQVQPKVIALSGAFATVRRAADGAVSVAVGPEAAQVGQAADFAQLLGAIDTVLLRSELAALTELELNALTLRYEDARSGRAWTVDGGQISLERSGADLRIGGNFSLLSGRDFATTIELNYATQIGETAAEFGALVQDIAAQDIASQGVALAWLDVLRAPISGALRGGVSEDGALGPLSATLQIGAGVLQPTDGTRPIPFSAARSYFTYDPVEQMLAFDELSVTSDWVGGTAEGRAFLEIAEDGTLNELIGQFALSDLAVNPDGLYPTPLSFETAAADFRLSLDPFALTLGQMHMTEGDMMMRVTGELGALATGWDLALDAQIDRITPERLVDYWPEAAAPKPRRWVDLNLSGGLLTDVDFALRSAPETRPDIYVDFAYEDVAIRFLKTLPPITGAAGQTTLVDGRFVTTTTQGQIIAEAGGALDVAGTSFIIPDLGIRKAAPGVARVIAEGPVTATLWLLDQPPIRALRNTALPVDMADGRARFQGTLALPLAQRVPFEQVQFHVNGTIDAVTSDVLVPGHQMAADQLLLKGNQNEIALEGDAQISGIPVRLAWRQPLGPDVGGSRVDGRIALGRETVDAFNLGLPPGSVRGAGFADFVLDLTPSAPPDLTLTSNLQGVGLAIEPLGWSKPTASAGQLNIEATLDETARVDRLELRAAGLSVTGTVQGREGGGLDRARLSPVRLGGWLDATVELTGAGPGSLPRIRVLGGRADLRSATFGPATGNTAPSDPLVIQLDQLTIAETLALTDFQAELTPARGSVDGPFRGKVNGGTEVAGRIVPQDGRIAVQATSDDAGGVFRDAGLLRQARGGDLELNLVPAQAPGAFEGSLRVTGTRVQDAPAIAALLDALSIVGLLDELGGPGIQFTEVDARFGLTPERLALYESSAVGPSMGLSMDGTYDLVTRRLNMQGVLSPVYLINGIGAVLTRKGEGLLGFSYKLTGSSQDPSVQVNPLSVLAPGMLRDVFRGPAPVSGSSSGEAPEEPRQQEFRGGDR